MSASSLVRLLCVTLMLSMNHFGQAVKFRLSPGVTECVQQDMDKEHFQASSSAALLSATGPDQIMSMQVTGARIDGRILVSGGNQYHVPFITIKLSGPHGAQIWEQSHVYSEAHMNVPAHGPGQYKVCFKNPHESRSEAIVDLVYLTLAHLRGGKSNLLIPKGTEEARTTAVAHRDDLETAKRTILSMTEFVEVVGGSQRYLQRKLDRHKKTLVSNSRRATGYALLEMAVLIGVVAIQVFTITSFFARSERKIITV